MASVVAQQRVRAVAQALIVLVALIVLRPFLLPGIWALILAIATWPVFLRVERWLGKRTLLAAALLTVAIVLLVLIPTLTLLLLAVGELQGTLPELKVSLAHAVDLLPAALRKIPAVGEQFGGRLESFLADPTARQQWMAARVGGFASVVASAAGSAGRAAAEALVTVLMLFVFYLHGHTLARQTRRAMRHFGGEQMAAIFGPMPNMIRAVLYGTLLTALAQGVLVMMALWIAGVGAPVLLGALSAALSLTPGGPALVWAPAAVWLFFQDRWLAGGLLLAWGVVVVSNVDNLIRSWVLSGAAEIPFILAIIGVLGGLLAFGMLGLFIGPVAVALALTLWREWTAEPAAAHGH